MLHALVVSLSFCFYFSELVVCLFFFFFFSYAQEFLLRLLRAVENYKKCILQYSDSVFDTKIARYKREISEYIICLIF